MHAYVLIVWANVIMGGYAGQTLPPSFQQFESLESCQFAAKTIEKNTDRRGSSGGLTMVCVPK